MEVYGTSKRAISERSECYYSPELSVWNSTVPQFGDSEYLHSKTLELCTQWLALYFFCSIVDGKSASGLGGPHFGHGRFA